MCEVELFDEALDAGPLANLLLGHGTGDLSGVHIDSGHDSVGEGALFGSLLVAYMHQTKPGTKTTPSENKINPTIYKNTQ